MKYAKKLLAIFLSFAVLSATFVFNIAVKATTQPYYFTVLHTGFEENTSADSTFYNQASNGYANGDDRLVYLVNSSGIGNGGSNYAMKLGYNNNPSNQFRPNLSFRCSETYNNRGTDKSFKTKQNYTYKLSFYYKAETVTSTVELWKSEFHASLAGQNRDVNNNYSVKLATISSATAGYVHVETTFTAVNGNDYNMIFILRPTNYSNVAGTTIYIDDITVMEQRNLESDYGTESFESASDMSGFNIYRTSNDWAISTDQNHTESGSNSAKFAIKAGYNSAAERPRMILKAAGNNFVATTGSTYIVSFWVYSPVAINSFNWYIYSSTSTSLGSNLVGYKEAQKSNVSLAVGWNKIVTQITVKGYNSSEHNYLLLGLTDSNAQAGYETKYFYLDDIKIQEIAETVTMSPVYQDFTNIGTVSGQKASKSNTNHPASGGGSAQVNDSGSKSGVSTPQAYIPGDNEYTRLCGEYNKRYRMTVSVLSTRDITAKIRWCGTTTLAGNGFSYETNHRVIAEQIIELEANEWTDITLVTHINNSYSIFEDKTVYFTLGGTVADSGDSSAYTFLFDNITVREVTKPGTPEVPVVESFTGNSVTLQTLSGGEYSLDNATWQDSNVFTGLTPWATYSFYQRIKETDTTIPSDSRSRASYLLVLKGDLDVDSDVDDTDYSILSQVVLEIEVVYNEDAADIKVDSTIDVCDLVSLDMIISES